MPQAITSIPQSHYPVIAAHRAADTAATFAQPSAAGMAIVRRLDRRALATRAGTITELNARLDMIRANLTYQEDASAFTLALLTAIQQDVTHLSGRGGPAPQTTRQRGGP